MRCFALRPPLAGAAIFLAGGLVLAAGCGPSDPLGRRAVSGTVTLDGAPLAEGTISFQPTEQGSTSSGGLVTQGKYSIPRDKGLPPGKYRVVINAIKPGTGMTLPEGKMPGEEVGTPPVELIPPEWNTTSQHFIDVPASGPTAFEHAIVTKKK
jgi:hypothetical protein